MVCVGVAATVLEALETVVAAVEETALVAMVREQVVRWDEAGCAVLAQMVARMAAVVCLA